MSRHGLPSPPPRPTGGRSLRPAERQVHAAAQDTGSIGQSAGAGIRSMTIYIVSNGHADQITFAATRFGGGVFTLGSDGHGGAAVTLVNSA